MGLVHYDASCVECNDLARGHSLSPIGKIFKLIKSLKAFSSETINDANRFVDLVFFLDILVSFRTTFMDIRTGNEVLNSKLIAKNYLLNRFWIDLLSMIPLDEMI